MLELALTTDLVDIPQLSGNYTAILPECGRPIVGKPLYMGLIFY